MTRARGLVSLWAVSVGLSALILAPLSGGLLGHGDLLYRDAVSTPRGFVTDVALGLGDAPARAVPQDWLVAIVSTVMNGSAFVIALTFAALVLAGVGFGRLAGHVVPAARTPGMLAAAVVAIWNPFVAERLLQGQWSLLLGYGALGWVILAAFTCRGRPGVTAWLRLAAWVAVAGLTPTGWVFAVVAAIVVVVPRPRAIVGVGGVAVVAGLPWMVAAGLSSAPVTSDGGAVAAFAARAETGLATIGTLAGLGGIWNADAVPASRTGVWTPVATVCLLAVVGLGVPVLLRRRRRMPLIVPLGALALITLVLVTLAATPPGRGVLEWLVNTVPGTGLLRDTSKFVALLVPFYAIAAAAAVQYVGRAVPRGLAAGVIAALVVIPLPDLAWGVGGSIETVALPDDFAAVARAVPADRGDVVILPTGSNRRYGFTDGVVSLDPSSRLLRASVLATGELRVDGAVVDAAPTSRAARAHAVLDAGGTPAELARLGVGWVLVEATGDPAQRDPAVLAALPVEYRGDLLTLYRVEGPSVVAASSTERALSWAAHLIWLALVVVGIGATGYARLRVGGGRRLFSWTPWTPHSPPMQTSRPSHD